MATPWDRIDESYRDYLANICSPEEFNASSLIERAQLRNSFLEECRKREREEHPKPNLKRKGSHSSDGSSTEIVSLIDDDDDDDEQQQQEEEKDDIRIADKLKEETTVELKTEPTVSAVTPSPPKRRRTRSFVKEVRLGTNAKPDCVQSSKPDEPCHQDKGSKLDNDDDSIRFADSVRNDQYAQDNEGSEKNTNGTLPSLVPSSSLKEEASGESTGTEGLVGSNEIGMATDLILPCSVSSSIVKKELTKEKLRVARELAYEKYADRALLHRFHGIGRLGGCRQKTFQQPSKGNKCVWDGEKVRKGYPLPKMTNVKNEGDNVEYDMDFFTCLTYNSTWQTNGPKFATQPTAAVDVVPEYMKTKGLSLPIFMNRSLTKKDSKREGKSLGWEYVGNYRCITDSDLVLWESASNISDASKRMIAEHYIKSAQSKTGDTYGKATLERWREFLEDEITNEKKKTKGKHSNKSISERAVQLGYNRGISDEDLIWILTEIDEFYGQEIIEFVEYDERIYEYCSKGLTSKNSKGNSYVMEGGTRATARDWYNFANQNMLM